MISADSVVSVSARVVTFVEDLDLTVADQAQRRVSGALAPGARVVLDLSGVGFADSSGLRLLVWAAREAEERGASLCIAGAGDWFTFLLLTSGVSSLFESFPTVAAALAGSAGGQNLQWATTATYGV